MCSSLTHFSTRLSFLLLFNSFISGILYEFWMWVFFARYVCCKYLLPLNWDQESGSLLWNPILNCILKISSWTSNGHVELHGKMDLSFPDSPSSLFTPSSETISSQKLTPFFIQLLSPILLNPFLYCKRKITFRKYVKQGDLINKHPCHYHPGQEIHCQPSKFL